MPQDPWAVTSEKSVDPWLVVSQKATTKPPGESTGYFDSIKNKQIEYPVYSNMSRQFPAKPTMEDYQILSDYQKQNADSPTERHQRAGQSGQGLDELGGALMAGVLGRAATTTGAAGVSAGLKVAGKQAANAATGAALGYGTEHLANKILPKNVSIALGLVAGLYGGVSAAKLEGNVAKFLQETESPTIGKFVKWMFSKEGVKVTPRPPGKGTGTKYGGPAPSEANPPGTNIPRGKFTPPEPKAQTPGKGTGTKYGGSREPDYTKPPTGGGKSSSGSLSKPNVLGQTEPAAKGTPKLAPDRFEGQRVVARDASIAKRLFGAGISSEDAKLMTSEHWATQAKAINAPAPNKASIAKIIAGIKKLESK